jgi:glutathione S-transferase
MTEMKVHSIPGSPYGRAVLLALERELGEHDYFGGDSPSLADVMIAAHVDFFTVTS